MKEQLNPVIFIYGTVTATALLVGQRERCEQMKSHGGESHGSCGCAIEHPSSVALHAKLCQSPLIKKALCRDWRCLETPGKAIGSMEKALENVERYRSLKMFKSQSGVEET